MKRMFFVYVVDFAAIFAASSVAYEVAGLFGAIAAAIVVVLYGVFCFFDGMTR